MVSQLNKKKAGQNLINTDTIASLQEEISYLWEIYRIDKYYEDVFMESLSNLSPKMYIQLMAKEIENLYNEKSNVQHIFLTIQKREEMIKCLKQMNQVLASNTGNTDLKDKAVKTLEGLRLASLAVVECAFRFREQLKSAYYLSGEEDKMQAAQKCPILYKEENYLVKMKNDTLFLASSEFAKLFNFSQKSDPFLVAPANPYIVAKGASKRKQLEALKAPSKQAVLELPVPPSLLKRIHAAELMIMEGVIATANDSRTKNDPNNAMPTTGRKEEDKQSPSSILGNQEKLQLIPLNLEQENLINDVDENAEELQNLQLLPLKITEEELPQFLAKYQTRVIPELIQSYCPLSDLLEKTQTGYTPHWLCFSYPGWYESKEQQIEGLAVFFIDPSCKARTRVTILHASVARELGKISDLLSEVLNYIWRNINCDEVRVGLAYIQQEGEKCIPYDPLKNAYQEIKFKWKTLTNDDLGNRILILGMNRPENIPFVLNDR